MPKEYTKEEWWKLYERLPHELKEAIFSPETAKTIFDTCKRNEILEKTSEIATYVGRVLLGALPLEEFRQVLKEELGLEEKTLKEISHDLNRFVFFPVKGALRKIYEEYEIEVAPPKPAEKKADIYREPVD